MFNAHFLPDNREFSIVENSAPVWWHELTPFTISRNNNFLSFSRDVYEFNEQSKTYEFVTTLNAVPAGTGRAPIMSDKSIISSDSLNDYDENGQNYLLAAGKVFAHDYYNFTWTQKLTTICNPTGRVAQDGFGRYTAVGTNVMVISGHHSNTTVIYLFKKVNSYWVYTTNISLGNVEIDGIKITPDDTKMIVTGIDSVPNNFSRSYYDATALANFTDVNFTNIVINTNYPTNTRVAAVTQDHLILVNGSSGGLIDQPFDLYSLSGVNTYNLLHTITPTDPSQTTPMFATNNKIISATNYQPQDTESIITIYQFTPTEISDYEIIRKHTPDAGLAHQNYYDYRAATDAIPEIIAYLMEYSPSDPLYYDLVSQSEPYELP